MEPNHPVLSALIKLHADLGGQIRENEKRRERLSDDMRHVEAVIRMFNPTFDTRRIAVKRRNQKNPVFKRGTLFRAALDVLRTATEPMTTAEILRAMLAAKGIAEPDGELLRVMFPGLQSALKNKIGDSVAVDDSKTPMRWRLNT